MSTQAQYDTAFVAFMLSALLLSTLLFLDARSLDIAFPLSFATPYEAFRTTGGLAFLAFSAYVILRHAVLMIAGTVDHLTRLYGSTRNSPQSHTRQWPLVSLIAPAYNEEKCIRKSIRSLMSLDYPRYEVIVVDDGSSDATAAAAAELEGDDGRVRVVLLSKSNGGKASALNLGISWAAGEIILTADADSVLSADCLTEAVKHFDDPDVGAVSGAVQVVNPLNHWTKAQALEYTKGLDLVRRAQGLFGAVSIIPGPIGVFRKAALADVGHYDTDTFAEDCDVTVKLLLNGWKVLYEPQAVSQTEAPEDLPAVLKQRYRWARGCMQVMRKYRAELVRPRGYLAGTISLWCFAYSAFLAPVVMLLAAVSLLAMGLDTELARVAGLFWAQLVLVELATSAYCLSIGGQPVAFAAWAVFERLIYLIIINVCWVLAMFEELWGVRMTWGKLERKGRL